jgi:TPP-dependent pyruvate/acetoin dehydrogenase alpha subunit
VNKQELIDFEEEVARDFNLGLIRAPIHLSGNNEDQLIEIFRDFKKDDWTFSNWRNHYHALLAGVPREEVKRQIMAGRSMTVCSPEHRFFSSAIFAGICPIALGVAWQIKKNGGDERVWIFIGDMCALSGLAYECINYARWHELPLVVVVEDNGKSVCTDTAHAWGLEKDNFSWQQDKNHLAYKYKLDWPHSGSGRRIQF